jgi:hypothetical protein
VVQPAPGEDIRTRERVVADRSAADLSGTHITTRFNQSAAGAFISTILAAGGVNNHTVQRFVAVSICWWSWKLHALVIVTRG